MHLDPSTSAFLTALEQLAGTRFPHRALAGDLLQIASTRNREVDLERLSFLGKFLVRSFGIMQRIGKDGDGTARLEEEFAVRLAEARSLLTGLLREIPGDERGQQMDRYLAMTPEGMENFLGLMRDLSWYKNWKIDNRGTRSKEPR